MTDRFTFDNRRLAGWLLQLIDEVASQRKAAAKVITDRFFMPTELLTEGKRTVEDLQSEFSAAVRAALNEPGFPAADFVRNLLTLDMALHDSWMEKARADRQRDNDADKADLAKMGENPTEADRRRYIRRVSARYLRDCKRIQEEEPHEVMTTGIAVVRIIQALGVELLPASDLLVDMLFSKHKAYLASDAIARMGRSGLAFYDDLLRGLKRDDPNNYSAKALGALLRDVPERIPEILDLACNSTGVGQTAAVNAFSYGGRRITEACPDVENRLRDLLEANHQDGIWYATVNALGCCGRSSETAEALLVRLDSADVGRKGELILALGKLGIKPEWVVPRLIEMLDVFEEYDPDWSYYGEHGRVVQALRGFGQAAAPAVPALIRCVWTKPQQYWTKDQKLAERCEPDEEVVQFLGELGASASKALPVLSQLRDEMRRRNAESSEANTADDADAYWNVAIRRIENRDETLQL